MTKQQKPEQPLKPCPDLPKGVRCPLCGGTYLCMQAERRKQAQEQEQQQKGGA